VPKLVCRWQLSMIGKTVVIGVLSLIALSLSGCDTSGNGASCFQVAFDNGELPLTSNGTEIDYNFSCKPGYEWDSENAPKIECSWVARECLISNNESCQDVFDFTKKGEGLTAWPEDEEPTSVEEFSHSFWEYLEAIKKKATKKAKAGANSALEKGKEAASNAKDAAGSAVDKGKEAASHAKAAASSAVGKGEEAAKGEESRRLALPKSISPDELKTACVAKEPGSATAKFQVFGSPNPVVSNSVSSIVFGAFAATIVLAVGCVVHRKLSTRRRSVKLSETDSDESIDGFE